MSTKDSGAVAASKQICSLGYGSVSVASDADVLLRRLVEIHGIDSTRHYWWESLATSRFVRYSTSGNDWREQIAVFLADMGDPVFLAITDDEPPPWRVLRIEHGSEVATLLSEMRFFEYFVFSQDCARVFFDTHDNVLISSP